MTLTEAIKHLEEALKDPERKWACKECKIEHIELLAFLRELEDSRKLIDYLKHSIKTYDFMHKVNESCREIEIQKTESE